MAAPPDLLVRVDDAAISDNHRTISLSFTGGRQFDPLDQCSTDYAASASSDGSVLEVQVVRVIHGNQNQVVACDAVGHSWKLDVQLPEPFLGSTVRDRGGGVLFVARPDGLVELTGLPDGWALRSESDVEESPTGRWRRTYSADPALTSPHDVVEFYQSFDGPVNVTGGDSGSQVMVGGKPATLYRWAPEGELVLVWTLGSDGFALVAYEQHFSAENLIRLAESVVPSDGG